MPKTKLVVIGGDAAGMSAASKVRLEDADREIVVFKRSPHTSYSACGLPYFIGGVVEDVERLVARSPETFRDQYRIDVRVGQKVVEIDLAATGGYATFPGVVGTAVSKICKFEVARTGLQEKEIQQLGFQGVCATITSKTRAGYYPGAGPITVKLWAETGSGRLLGGQIVGIEGAAKRIDVLATALHAGMSVGQIVDLDLSYAPPYSPVWDPVQTAARQVVKEV